MKKTIETEPDVGNPSKSESDQPKPIQETKEALASDIKEYQEKGQKLIDSYNNFFTTFAKDISLSFRMSNGFYINLENGEVNLDTNWFADKGFSEEQIIWAILHELSHFRDLSEDSKGVLGQFSYMENKAKEIGALMMKKWEEKYGKTDPEFIETLKKQSPISKKNPSKTMNQVEQAAYKMQHTFFNIMNDIYVNKLVARKAPRYEENEKSGKAIKELYQQKLFAQTDYSKLPRHLQFAYFLIRKAMVPDEEVKISEEVAENLNQKILFQGKGFLPQEIIENFIKPRGGRDTKASQRSLILQNTLEPVFQNLLLKDLDDWDPEKPPQQPNQEGETSEDQSNAANPFDQDYQDYDENNPDQISEEDIKEWARQNDEEKQKQQEAKAKENEKENKTPEQKANEAQEAVDKNWCEKNGINYETFKQYKQIEKKVSPYLEELSLLWRDIVFGKNKQSERGEEGYFETGSNLDIQRVIDEFPKIQAGNIEKALIFKRIIMREVLVKKPELIRLRLVGDLSGSMKQAKKDVLQQCFVLLLASIREFNTHLNLTRWQTKSELEADTEAWVFGTNCQKIKSFRKETGNQEELIEIIKIFEKLQGDLGNTSDDKPLNEILRSLSQDDLEKISQEEIMEMVVEITDGGSSAPEKAKKAVDNLEENNAIPGAFLVGEVDEEDLKIFNNVWNKGRQENLGYVVGKNVANLLPAVTLWLKKYLSGVRL